MAVIATIGVGKPFEIEDFYGTLLEALHLGLSDIAPLKQAKKNQKRERFDKEGAIKKLGGAEFLWNKTFCSFYEQYQNAPYTLSHLINEKDVTTLIDYVHTIKGLCGTVGAYILSDEASKMESFLKTHKNPEKLDTQSFCEEHTALFSSLKSLYEALQEKMPSSQVSLEESSYQEVYEILNQLQSAIETSHISRMNSLLDDVANYPQLLDNSHFKSVVLACKMFDFDSALTHVESLKKELSHG